MTSREGSASFAFLKEKILRQNGRDYWRSVEEFVDAPEFEEFVKEEYPSHAEEWDNTLSRRNFVKVMGASLAFAGLSGCVIQPAEKIVPYVTQPVGLTPGKALYYATSMTLGGVANGLLARSNEGRPTKLEGNPDHPGSLGSTDVLAQASLLNLYDPDRSKEILYRAAPKSWKDFMTAFRDAIDENRKDGGAGVRFLTETVTSPTLAAQFEQVATELPNAKWAQYEPINDDNVIEGAKLVFGTPSQPVYKFDKAERILSLDADFLSGFNSRYVRDFAKGRSLSKEKEEMNRLYAIETSFTLVGAKADHRLAVKPSELVEAAKAAAGAVGVGGTAGDAGKHGAWIKAMAEDLLEHKGKSLVVAGSTQPAYVHALAFAMNAALENIGQTVEFIEPLRPNAEKTQLAQLRELVDDIDNGRVKMLVVLGANPAYNTPSDLRFTKQRMSKIPMRVHLGEYRDETAVLCQWHVAAANYLEAWSDGRAFDGTVSIVQPLIDPLYGGKSAHEILQLVFTENFEKKGIDIVKEHWQKQGLNISAAPAAAEPAKPEGPQAAETEVPASPDVKNFYADIEPAKPAAENGGAAPSSFEDGWRRVVHNGFIAGSNSASKAVTANTAFAADPPKPAGEGAIEFNILPDPCVYDGRFANNGWLQELPNPFNKVTWENVALLSPNTANELGINQNKDYNDFAGGELGRAFINTKGGNLESDLLEVTFEGQKLPTKVPAWIAPGQADGVVTLFLGYGRTRAGKVGDGLGYDAYALQKSGSMWSGKGTIVNTNETTTVASTQIHFNMEGRDIVRNWEFDEIEEKAKDHHAA